jgi:biotin carboxyl carrier protein
MSRELRVAAVGEDRAGEAARDLDPAGDDAPVLSDLGRGRVRVGARSRVAAVVDRLADGPDGTAGYEVVVDGWRFELAVEDAARARLRRRATRSVDATAASGSADIRAIIPGRVVAVRVAAGDAVEEGQTLLVVEAMKMQNELRAAQAGTVERVAVGEGQTIDRGDLLVVLR